jgi:N-methylhydantoinase A
MASCTLAIDVGGLTDVTLADAATGTTWISRPYRPRMTFPWVHDWHSKILTLGRSGPTDIMRVFHGTTTATNAILEARRLDGSAHHKGFKYVLEIGRRHPARGNLYGWIKPTRPVTPDRIFE